MLVPSSSRTLQSQDMANAIFMKVFGTSTSEILHKYQLGLTEITVGTDLAEFERVTDERAIKKGSLR